MRNPIIEYVRNYLFQYGETQLPNGLTPLEPHFIALFILTLNIGFLPLVDQRDEETKTYQLA